MAIRYTRPKGTMDILPQDSWKWLELERRIHRTAGLFGYREIRVPTFESTDVFSRGVGEGTDIVSKEMYTFLDKGGRSVTLRPEGTAGVVRATLENGLLASSPLPLKCYYLQSCFRYENSQKGRYREFHQFGIECFGTHAPDADVEVMEVAAQLMAGLGLEKFVTLEINSIGCPKCRPRYNEELKRYFESHAAELCDDCRQRLAKNPMRLLDCKEERCQRIAKDAPVILDYLCEDCVDHFDQVKEILDGLGRKYVVNPRIVRGLDYYTNTVFEFIAKGIGTQGTVCAGGRYDGLIEELGGQPTPGVGFGMGVERLLLLLEENGKLFDPPVGPAIYAVAMGDKGRMLARRLTAALRNEQIAAEYDIAARSIKAQMKAAGRLGALYSVVLGDEEAESGIVRLKRMRDGAEVELPLVGLVSAFKYVYGQDPTGQSEENLEQLVEAAGPVVSFGSDTEEA